MSRKLIVVVAFWASSILSGSAFSQGSALAEFYGDGVHHYFSGCYTEAEQLLTRAIDYGSKDPRVFYFRGLAREAYGGDGSFDFEEGARLEATGGSGANVGQALVRIQGRTRAKIEKARRDARLDVHRQRALLQQTLPAVPQPIVPLDPMLRQPPSATDPFLGDGLRSPNIESVPVPIVPGDSNIDIPLTDDSFNDPFQDESAPSTDELFEDSGTEESTDPFGEPSSPLEEVPGEDASIDEDPFG